MKITPALYAAPEDRGHACCATAGLGPLARGTANHRRENYFQTQHSTRPALEPPPVEATSLETQPASLRCALRPHHRFRPRWWPAAGACQRKYPAPAASGDRGHACCATAVLGPLARETANHRRENYFQTQHSTRPAL